MDPIVTPTGNLLLPPSHQPSVQMENAELAPPILLRFFFVSKLRISLLVFRIGCYLFYAGWIGFPWHDSDTQECWFRLMLWLPMTQFNNNSLTCSDRLVEVFRKMAYWECRREYRRLLSSLILKNLSY